MYWSPKKAINEGKKQCNEVKELNPNKQEPLNNEPKKIDRNAKLALIGRALIHIAFNPSGTQKRVTLCEKGDGSRNLEMQRQTREKLSMTKINAKNEKRNLITLPQINRVMQCAFGFFCT